MIDALRTVNLLMTGMMAGGLVMVMVAVIPTFHRLPAVLAVRLHREVDRYIDVPLPAFTLLAIVTAIPLLLDNGESATAAALTAVALGAAVSVSLSSHLVNRPMNKRLKSWGDGSVPAEYPALRRRWDIAHAVRTLAGVTSLVCIILATLIG